MEILRKFLRTDDGPSVIPFPDFNVEVDRKRVKTLRIMVYPGAGRVRVSAPMRATDAAVKAFVGLKIDWIRKHLSRGAAKPKALLHEYVSGETHFFLGEPYRLEIEESAKPRAFLRHECLVLGVPA